MSPVNEQQAEFPRTLAAVQAREKTQWQIGDALLAECGAPSTQGGRDNSYEKLKACAAELAAHGFQHYDIKHLARLRSVAHAFPETARRAVSWAAHREAKTSEALDEIMAAAALADQVVTRDHVRSARQACDGGQERAQRTRRDTVAAADAQPQFFGQTDGIAVIRADQCMQFWCGFFDDVLRRLSATANRSQRRKMAETAEYVKSWRGGFFVGLDHIAGSLSAAASEVGATDVVNSLALLVQAANARTAVRNARERQDEANYRQRPSEQTQASQEDMADAA